MVMDSGRLAEEGDDAVAHLAGRLVGEGDGQDAVGVDAALGHQVGDAVGDDARLAAAGPRQDEEGPAFHLHRFPLGRIEGGEDVHLKAWSF